MDRTFQRVVARGAERVSGRSVTIDNMRALGIVLVVVAHIPGVGELSRYIFAFHMPLFFFISGSVFSRDPGALHWGTFIRKQSRSLLAPYVLFFVLAWLYWLLTRNLVGRAPVYQRMDWWIPLLGLASGRFSDLAMINGPLWFLPCLFVASLLQCAFYRYLPVWGARMLGLAIAFAVLNALQYLRWQTYWNLGQSFVAVGFMVAGEWASTASQRYTRLPNLPNRVLGVGAVFLVFVFAASDNGRFDLQQALFGHSALQAAVGAMAGIALTLLLASLLPQTRLFYWLSTASIVIFPSHAVTLNLLSGVAKLGFGFHPWDTPSVVYPLLAAPIAIATAWPLQRALQHTLPWVFPTQVRFVGRVRRISFQ